MVRRGFTIVELLIVIAVMGILLVLAVVNLRGTQINARDSERTSDIAAIATNLETFYTDNNYYPSINLIGDEVNTLPNIDPKILVAPGKSSASDSFFAANINTQTTTGVTPQPNNTTYSYIYQPIASDNSLCSGTTQCIKFNLYYLKESDDTVHKVTSRHQ